MKELQASVRVRVGRASTMNSIVITFSLATATLEGCTNCMPTTEALGDCQAKCDAAGHCCDDSTYASSHGLLSCHHGCRIAWYAGTRDECTSHCTLGNSGGCSYTHPEAGTLHKCGSCGDGCASTDANECARGCDFAEALGTFYHGFYYTPPPPPPPHPHASCATPTGLSASFVENIEGTAHWSSSAVFDDEVFAYVAAGEASLSNERGLLCVDGESTPHSPIDLFDDGLGGDDVAGDNRYTRSCLSICPGILSSVRAMDLP